jgi:hypothetical protein
LKPQIRCLSSLAERTLAQQSRAAKIIFVPKLPTLFERMTLFKKKNNKFNGSAESDRLPQHQFICRSSEQSSAPSTASTDDPVDNLVKPPKAPRILNELQASLVPPVRQGPRSGPP